MKYTINDCHLLAEKKHGKCLTKVYTNSYTKMLWKCVHGHTWKSSSNKIQQNHWCPECVGLKKKTIEECRQLAKQKNGQCLTEVCVNNHTKMLWQCDRKHQWLAKYNTIRTGHWCPDCAGLKRKTIEDCQKLALSKNGKCLSLEYKNSRTKILWECKFGHQWWMAYNNVVQDQWCPECVGKKKHTIQDCQKLAEIKKGKCLSQKYINAFTKYLWQCEKLHCWQTVFHNVQQGSWCPVCKSKSQKQLFEIIKNLFPGCDIRYNFKGFDWLTIGKRKQEIDIFVSDLKLAIEYDGQQHYRSVEFWGGQKQLEKIQKYDQNKNKLISEHPEDIRTFIRIPYTEPITEENVRKILKL